MERKCRFELDLRALFAAIQEAESQEETKQAIMTFVKNCKSCPDCDCPGFMELLFSKAQAEELEALPRAAGAVTHIRALELPPSHSAHGD